GKRKGLANSNMEVKKYIPKKFHEGTDMKLRNELHRELRQRVLSLPGVSERQNAGIHEDAFLVGGKMFMHIHGHGHCDIRLAKEDQEQILAEGKARPHRWAPEKGYV